MLFIKRRNARGEGRERDTGREIEEREKHRHEGWGSRSSKGLDLGLKDTIIIKKITNQKSPLIRSLIKSTIGSRLKMRNPRLILH